MAINNNYYYGNNLYHYNDLSCNKIYLSLKKINKGCEYVDKDGNDIKKEKLQFMMWKDVFDYSITLWIFVVACLFLILPIEMTILEKNPNNAQTKIEYKDKQAIMSLEDNLSSDFKIGFSDERQLNYYVLAGTKKDGFKVSTFEGETTRLFFDEEKAPYVRTKVINHKIQYKNGFLIGHLLKPITKDHYSEKIQELHLPKNVIKIKYHIDMK